MYRYVRRFSGAYYAYTFIYNVLTANRNLYIEFSFVFCARFILLSVSIIWQEKTADARGDGRIKLKQYLIFSADKKRRMTEIERDPD